MPELDLHRLRDFLQRSRESGNRSINLRPRNNQRRLKADDIAIDAAHAHQHALAQQPIANSLGFGSGRCEFFIL